MHRTQVYLEDDQYRALQARARREGKSLAAVVRELLDAALGRDDERPDALDEVIGLARGDGAAVAEHHADYLYGEKR